MQKRKEKLPTYAHDNKEEAINIYERKVEYMSDIIELQSLMHAKK